MKKITRNKSKFSKLHSSDIIKTTLHNINRAEQRPINITISSNYSSEIIKNKLILKLQNVGFKKLHFGGPYKTGVYLNLSDCMSLENMHKLKFSIKGQKIQSQLLLSSTEIIPVTGEKIKLVNREEEHVRGHQEDPSMAPEAKKSHLGTDWMVYLWTQNEIILKYDECLEIEIENLISDFRPAIRYISASWVFKTENSTDTNNGIDSIEGFKQFAVELERPINYSPPPFPLMIHWLGESIIYSSIKEKDEVLNTTLNNELYLAISNITKKDFELDTSRHSRGMPYFELKFVIPNRASLNKSEHALAKIEELVNINVKAIHHSSGIQWRVNRKDQGPKVKWEIRPDLEKSEYKNKILGTELDAVQVFKISDITTSLEAGITPLYFRYYNMPDHDDGQLILWIEKRRIADYKNSDEILKNGGDDLLTQLDKDKNLYSTPLHWELVEEVQTSDKNEKIADESLEIKPTNDIVLTDNIKDNGKSELVQLKTKMRIGDPLSPQASSSSLDLDINGNIEVNGNMVLHNNIGIMDNILCVLAGGMDHEKNLDQKAILKLVACAQKSSMGRSVELAAESDGDNMGSKLTISTRRNPKEQYDNGRRGMHNCMVIDSEGNVGINKDDPNEKLDVHGNVKIDGTLKLIGLDSYGRSYGSLISLDGNYRHIMFQGSGQIICNTSGSKTHSLEFKEKSMLLNTKGELDFIAKKDIAFYNGEMNHKTLLLTTKGHLLIGPSGSPPNYPLTVIHNNKGYYVGSPTAEKIDYLTEKDPRTDGGINKRDVDISIYSSDCIATKRLIKFSDRRIKTNITNSQSHIDLETIRKLKVRNYRLKEDNKLAKGFIAQEVFEHFPQAVSNIKDFVPSIFSKPKTIVRNDKLVKITCEQVHELKNSEVVRFFISNEPIERPIALIDEYSFEIHLEEKYEKIDDLFVFGKLVDDFKVLDYNSIYNIGISAIQQLAENEERLIFENNKLKSQVKENQQRISGLEDQLRRISNQINQLMTA